ncbi:recombinase family protein [Kocuria marina]|uniref:recombinase family protein n=1 Tax=Kocuria marina TaxID=223184 RepID=UPI00346032CE
MRLGFPRSVSEGTPIATVHDLDTASPAGKLVVSVLALLAEWERDTLRERSRAGLEYARSQGRHGGRPPCRLNRPMRPWPRYAAG